MTLPSRSVIEFTRLNQLRKTGLIYSGFVDFREQIARTARDFGVPVMAITLIGQHFQHVKASFGTDLSLMHRDHAFCSHTILGDAVLVVEDATRDERFRLNPYVVGDPNIRFYAGAPLHAAGGHRIGAVCMIDTRPRELSAQDRSLLLTVTADIELKLHAAQRAKAA